MLRSLTVLLFTCCLTLTALCQSEKYLDKWSDPSVRQRIDDGIERNRKGDVHLAFEDAKGRPLKEVVYEIQQVSHEFLFGANIFMVNGFDAERENSLFASNFMRLFNYASAPFYWKTLEPEPGKLRFEASSEEIYRRPPPDMVLDFCRGQNLTIKGHTLVWENPTHSMPDWVPNDPEKILPLIDKRIREIAERYGESIKIWDVVNESLQMHPGVAMPKDYVFESFKKAEKYLPDAQLLINEVTGQSWDNLRHANSPYYLQIHNLLCRGAKIDGIGLQFHFFSEDSFNKVVTGEAMTPDILFRALDLLSDFDKPLHVTEITIPTLPATAEGEEIQAVVTENYYRLWFSHPKVEAITWWNMVDETAVPGEDKWKGGLLRRDFSVKPSFTTLDKLINVEWKTRLNGKSAGPELDFRGFYGTYKIKIKKGRKVVEKEITVSKKGNNHFVIVL